MTSWADMAEQSDAHRLGKVEGTVEGLVTSVSKLETTVDHLSANMASAIQQLTANINNAVASLATEMRNQARPNTLGLLTGIGGGVALLVTIALAIINPLSQGVNKNEDRYELIMRELADRGALIGENVARLDALETRADRVDREIDRRLEEMDRETNRQFSEVLRYVDTRTDDRITRREVDARFGSLERQNQSAIVLDALNDLGLRRDAGS